MMTTYREEYELFLSLAENVFKASGIKNKINEQKDQLLPIISFEGVPGSGKTTQIELVSKRISEDLGKCAILELPAGNNTSHLLRTLYQDPEHFFELEKHIPWLNPMIITVELYAMIKKFKEEGYKYVFMSRGLFSTIYYHWNAFKKAGHGEDSAFEELMKICQYFITPKVVLYLDLQVEIAVQRIYKRNRLPLRNTDNEEGLIEIKQTYSKIFERFPNIPVETVNVEGSINQVTEQLLETLRPYLEG